MEHAEQGRRDVLKKVGLLGAASALALMSAPQPATAKDGSDGSDGSNPLVGVWTITFNSVTYPGNQYIYIYSMGNGNYVASGNIDAGFFGETFSPTMGAYVHTGGNTVRYHEKGWVYNQSGGAVIGTFEATGTFTVSPNGKTIAGPGTYTQYDLNGNVMYGPEQLQGSGTKLVP